MELRAVSKTLVSSPPKPAFPNFNRLTAFDGEDDPTAIRAVPDLLESAALVAVTVSVPAFEGAVYTPDEVMVPKEAFQMTVLSATVPCTVAVN